MAILATGLTVDEEIERGTDSSTYRAIGNADRFSVCTSHGRHESEGR